MADRSSTPHAPRRRWPFVLGGLVALVVVAALVFRWDWLIPVVESRASAALGRPVTIQHLHVALGRRTRIEAEGVTIANPPDWPGGGTFATAERLGIDLDAAALLHDRATIVIPVIDLQAPRIEALQNADGTATWTLPASSGDGGGPTVKLGTLRIADGQVHVKSDKLRADVQVALKTEDGDDGKGRIAADAKGTYAGQPILATFHGGALLSLRDAATPYPVDLKLSNGPTRIALTGTVDNPLAFAGTSLKLELSGPDMEKLMPLLGIALPATPPYRIAGKLDYEAGSVKFTGIDGKVGASDLAGDLAVDTKPDRPVLTATLRSKLVDLKDLAGFIGAEPDADGKGRAPHAAGRVLPNDPISLPKLDTTDVHLDYRAASIRGRAQPLDNMQAKLDIENGNVTLHPLSFGIGPGRIVGNIDLSQAESVLHAKAKIDFQRVDLSKLMNATGVAKGAGAISGQATIDGKGRSLAQILGFGNGEIRLFMGPGGNISAILVDLSGLQFGKAVLSALGVPDRAILQCAALDFSLRNGLATARTAIVDTDTARIGMKGWISLNREMIGLVLETDSKHFSIGSLPTPIDIGGTFDKPSVSPQAGPLAVRAGAAVALGIVGTPLAALLPTIQLGTGEDGACRGILRAR